MKRIAFVLSFVLILALFSVSAFAEEIIINIDSTKVEFNDDLGFPFIDENFRTLVPFRATLEKYGAEVEWNNDTRTATASKDEIVIEIPIDENYIIKNGQEVTVDTAAKIVNGRTYLPIRPVVEAFGSEVEWDSMLNTVVITRQPIDAKAIYDLANEKSLNWENYDVKADINMSIGIPDDAGSIQSMDMNMKMNMTMFVEPFKIKMKTLMPLTEEVLQPFMEMYMTINEDAITQYIGMNDNTGEFQWIKQTIKSEMLSDIINNKETIEKNKELTDKYTKDIKYFGKYTDEAGKSLLRLQYTLSGDIYKEVFGEASKYMPEPSNEQEAMTIEMINSLADINIGDLTYIIYIDEETGEMVKIEMDLGEMISAMMPGMTEILGDMPEEALEIFNNLEATMSMEFLNINKAEDFEIPAEALDAPELSEMMDELDELNELDEPNELDELDELEK